MIEKLFPCDVVSVVAKPEMWAEELHPNEAALISGAVAKRRREFAAGRSCARKALRILGFEGNAVLVGRIGSRSGLKGWSAV
jgi:4'-phosphopantetheinyl transferase EntD